MITVGKSLADYTFEELEALDKNIQTKKRTMFIKQYMRDCLTLWMTW